MQPMHLRCWLWCGIVLAISLGFASPGDAACGYVRAKKTDVVQPAQQVFLTWDPEEKVETFTVQPRFEGNARDFGMVIPTPSPPQVTEMPRDFFKNLAVYTALKRRAVPRSQLLPATVAVGRAGFPDDGAAPKSVAREAAKPLAVQVLEAGVVGGLQYKIIAANRADELYQWLKDNQYNYAGDEATLNFYVQKKWCFTVAKIDTAQLKRKQDGSFAGQIAPTRFQFTSEKLIYPLRITRICVNDKTDVLFYVQAPYKVDLAGDNSYQHTWVPLLQAAAATPGGLPGRGGQWLKAFHEQIPGLLQRAQALEYRFVAGQRPPPNRQGHVPTTLEWAHKLTDLDMDLFDGKAPYSEKVPDVDEGFTQADLKDARRSKAVIRVIQDRLRKAQQDRPLGYLVRAASAEDVRALQQLTGPLQAGQFITKFRKTFARDEMNDDLSIVPARYGDAVDDSEYEELLPVPTR